MFSMVFIFVLTLRAGYIDCDNDDSAYRRSYQDVKGPIPDNRLPPPIILMPNWNLFKHNISDVYQYQFEPPKISFANINTEDNIDNRWAPFNKGYDEDNHTEESYEDGFYKNDYYEEESYENESYDDEYDNDEVTDKDVTLTRTSAQNANVMTRNLANSHKNDNDETVTPKNMNWRNDHNNQSSTSNESLETDTSNKTDGGPNIPNRFMPADTIKQNWGFDVPASSEEIEPVAPRSGFINTKTRNKPNHSNTVDANKNLESNDNWGFAIDENEEEEEDLKSNDTEIETKSKTEKINRNLSFLNSKDNDGKVLARSSNNFFDIEEESTNNPTNTVTEIHDGVEKTHNSNSSNSATIHVICPLILLISAIKLSNVLVFVRNITE